MTRLDVYRYSEQQRVHFPSMGEFWFLDYGMLEAHSPRILGSPPGDVRAGFQWGARITERCRCHRSSD